MTYDIVYVPFVPFQVLYFLMPATFRRQPRTPSELDFTMHRAHHRTGDSVRGRAPIRVGTAAGWFKGVGVCIAIGPAWPTASFGGSSRRHKSHGEAISDESGNESHRDDGVGRMEESADGLVTPSCNWAPPNLGWRLALGTSLHLP